MTPFTVELLVNAVFILLFAINIFIGYRRGFVKTFFSFITFAASFFISCIFAKPLASLLKNTSLYTGIFSRLKSTLLSAERRFQSGSTAGFTASRRSRHSISQGIRKEFIGCQ